MTERLGEGIDETGARRLRVGQRVRPAFSRKRVGTVVARREIEEEMCYVVRWDTGYTTVRKVSELKPVARTNG